jgi:glycosyltransferase involved in cell wall biosynthesis
MPAPTLTYVMTTRNKLAFLRHALPLLLANVQDDEEIVVVDGASTDGTTEYLRHYYVQGKIHQFVSEPDKGEAHALNKSFLMARGDMVKVVTDDDVFHYPTIRRCKEYMLANPEADILGSEGGITPWGATEQPLGVTDTMQEYERWTREGRPFFFAGPGMILRKRSLPFMGLIHTGIVNTDQEYSRRVTSLPVTVAWCSGLTFVWIKNPASNLTIQDERNQREMPRILQFYNCEPPRQPMTLWRRIAAPLRWALRPIKNRLVKHWGGPQASLPPLDDEAIGRAFAQLSDWLDKRNACMPCSFRLAKAPSR